MGRAGTRSSTGRCTPARLWTACAKSSMRGKLQCALIQRLLNLLQIPWYVSCSVTLLDSDISLSIYPHFCSFALCIEFTLWFACRLLATFMTPPRVSRAGTLCSSPWAAATSASAAAATKRSPGRSVATQLPSKITRPFPYPAAP